MTSETSVPTAAKWLGFSGLIPFLAGALATLPVMEALRPFGVTLLLAYGAIILSFMGGVHWGVAMLRDDPDSRALAASVVSSLVALPAALIGGAAGLLILAAGFAGLLFYDTQEASAGRLPAWYPLLRRPLTAVVVACLLIGAGARLF